MVSDTRTVAEGTDMKCPNCDDGCKASRFCDGCDEVLCASCWAEHNEDAPCHCDDGQ